MEMEVGIENGKRKLLLLNILGYGMPLFSTSSYIITITWLVLNFTYWIYMRTITRHSGKLTQWKVHHEMCYILSKTFIITHD